MSRRGWVLFTAMSLIWGIPYLLIKVADGGVSVPVLVFARVGGGALVLLPIAARRRQLGVLLPRWRWLALFACVEIILPWLFLSAAERRLSSSLSGLLIASVPIIGVALARLTGAAERLTPLRWAGLLGGLAGVALLAAPGMRGGDAWSVILVMLTAVGYATGPLIASRKLARPARARHDRRLPRLRHRALRSRRRADLACEGAVRPGAGQPGGAGPDLHRAGLRAVLQAHRRGGPARATVITYVNPAVAVALGVGVLGEPLTPEIIAAFGLILAGSVLATRPGLPRPPSRPPGPASASGPDTPARAAARP